MPADKKKPTGGVPTSVENGGTPDGFPFHEEGDDPAPDQDYGTDEFGRALNAAGQPAAANVQPGGPADLPDKMTKEERQRARETQNPEGREKNAEPDPHAYREVAADAEPVHSTASPDPIHIVSTPQQA